MKVILFIFLFIMNCSIALGVKTIKAEFEEDVFCEYILEWL